MSTVVFVAGPDPGHALPVLGVARAVRARGHTTVVATGTQHQRHVELEGHQFLELPLLAATANDDDFAHVVWRRAGEMAHPLRELLAPLDVAVIVTDTLTTVGSFVADMLGVPWLEVVPHHLVDPDPLVAPVGMGRGPATNRWRRRSDDRIRTAQHRGVAVGQALRDEVRTGIGLGPATAPSARLIQTLPGLEPQRASWPPDAHVVGAIALDPPLTELQPPAGDGPLVVVTDSTANGLPAPLGEAAVAGIGATGRRLVVTTGREQARDVAANVVVGLGPHGPLLDQAAVAVTPGGGGFTAKALSRGVPLIVVPLAGDQQETAGRVARSGAGLWLPARRATPNGLRRAVERVLGDPSYAANARTLAATAQGRGPEQAAQLVEQAIAGACATAVAP